MLLCIQLSNSISRFTMCQIPRFSIDLLQRKQLLLFELDGTSLVLYQSLLLQLDKLSLLLKLGLESLNRFLVHLTLCFH